MRAIKRMGAGMVERYGQRPGREAHQPAFTVRASAGGMEPGGFVWQGGVEMTEVLRVTAQEAATLQGYPDGFAFEGLRTKQFLQIGNAVPPPVARAVLAHLWKEAA